MQSARRRWRVVGAVLGVAVAVGALAVNMRSDDSPTPTSLSMIVSPHPDDEMQAWSLIEDTPSQYKVFVFLTRGEESRFCADDLPGYNDGTGERAPSPTPLGKWTSSCVDARIASTNRFIEQMGAADPGVPDSLGPPVTISQFPSNDVDALRCDASCTPSRGAEIFDGGTLGTVVYFDLGDGDLTADEVVWAVETVLQQRDRLGIPDLPWDHVIGASYANSTHPECFSYPHPDHRAVHEALWTNDFVGVDERYAATCARNPDVALVRDVSDTSFDTAFAVSGSIRVGHHTRDYGWLHNSYYAGDFSTSTQSELFHRHQTFWRRS